MKQKFEPAGHAIGRSRVGLSTKVDQLCDGTAYRGPDRAAGKATMTALIDSIAAGVPAGLPEVDRLGRTLARRADDVLAFFDRPSTSNGPTEAINGRLEHFRGIALGFRHLTHYTARSILEAGGFKRHLHP